MQTAKIKERQLDILFVHPSASTEMFQKLSDKYSAIEPPTWCLLLAQSCYKAGFGAAILDCEAEKLSPTNVLKRILELNPRLVCWIAFGSQPNASSMVVGPALRDAELLKTSHPEYKICFGGPHINALPEEILSKDCVDFVLLNEGVLTLHSLLNTDLETDLNKVDGLGWKQEGKLILNNCDNIIPSEKMDELMPGSAWHLLPYKNKPLDLYKSHYWHANYTDELRTPFASLYTSLGCFAKCEFCMINSINRNKNGNQYNASNFNVMRFWSPQFIIQEFDKLIEYGVKTIRIADELFFAQKRYFEPLLKLIIERGYGKFLQLWTYSRVDTVREQYLELFRAAGIKYLALGIESGNQKIRQEVAKGSYKETDVRAVIKQIHDAGIDVISNGIFGLPEDNLETMEETYQLLAELNTAAYNVYPCFALPGSPLYTEFKQNNPSVLPIDYEEYTFLGYNSKPLPTKYLSAAEVVRYRDEAWQRLHSKSSYLFLIERKFGQQARKNIEEMSKIRLRRKILGD